MYSNESKNGFSVLDLLVKIIFAALFIFILIWLFNKKMPNMTAVNSGVFRENIKYMQDAGEAYFTDDKMPVNTGESVKLTLKDMEDLNLVLPFVDKNGKACDKDASYVSVTKLEGLKGYELKTNLVCGKEKNYVVKILGCHTYCPTGNCNPKKCEISKITEYEYRKLVEGTTTKYSCPSGYTLKGTTCYKTTLKDSKSAITSKTVTKPATVITGQATLSPLTVVVGTKTETKDATATTTTDTKTATATTDTKTATATTDTKTATATTTTDTKTATATTDTKTATATTSTQSATPKTTTSTQTATKTRESYSCTKTRTVEKCETKYRQEGYSCNCSTKFVGGQLVTTCDTCYKSVPYQSCKDVQESYTDTCYRDKYTCPSGYTLSGTNCTKTTTTYTCPSGYTLSGTSCKKTTYSCPSGYTLSGTSCKKTTYSCPSGYTLSGTTCSKKTTTYSCPSGYTLSGTSCKKTTYSCPSGYTLSGTSCKKTTYSCPSGYTLSGTKCTKKTTTYSCASGYTLSGTKCSRQVKTYTCPSGTDVQEGSGSSLKCYKLVAGSVSYKCDSGYTLSGTTCSKTETVKECKDKGYKLEGNKCNLYETTTTKATGKTSATTSYKYMWSKETKVAGYERTGKTRTVNGEEICK